MHDTQKQTTSGRYAGNRRGHALDSRDKLHTRSASELWRRVLRYFRLSLQRLQLDSTASQNTDVTCRKGNSMGSEVSRGAALVNAVHIRGGAAGRYGL